jgi:hypothetical protein
MCEYKGEVEEKQKERRKKKKKRKCKEIDKQFDEKKTRSESYYLFNQPDYT